MNILQVTPFYPPHVGGIERHVEILSKELAKAGHKVTIYTSNIPKSKTYEVLDNIEIYRFKSLFSLLNNQFVLGCFPKLVGNSDNFDVIHAHGYLHFSSNLVAFSRIFKFKKRPIVLTTHGTEVGYQGWKNLVERAYRKSVGLFMLKLFDKVIALSLEEANLLEKMGISRSKIEVVPNGIDLRQVNSEVDIQDFMQRYGLDYNYENILLFVGSLIPRKGINFLIDAMKHIESNTALLIVGEEIPGYAGFRKILEQQVRKLGLENRVIFLGRVSKEDLERAYIVADLLILPSISEVFGLVLIEAMSYGKCVVASKTLGPSSIIQNYRNGVLFEVCNTLQLAEEVNYLLENPKLRKRLGRKAKRDVEKRYSLEVVVNRIIDIYEELVSNEGAL